MRDDLQDLVDEVSRVLGAPATLEDREFTLLAFCAHDGTGPATPGATMDTVRARSILGRSSTPEVRAWFERVRSQPGHIPITRGRQEEP